MQGVNIHHVYNAMVVLHICKSILGIPLPEYPGSKNSNLDAYQILTSI